MKAAVTSQLQLKVILYCIRWQLGISCMGFRTSQVQGLLVSVAGSAHGLGGCCRQHTTCMLLLSMILKFLYVT